MRNNKSQTSKKILKCKLINTIFYANNNSKKFSSVQAKIIKSYK